MSHATKSAVRGLLRFLTADSADDGKRALIGRLLCDSESICADQIAARIICIESLADIDTQEKRPADACDAIRSSGSFTAVDGVTHQPVAAGMTRLV